MAVGSARRDKGKGRSAGLTEEQKQEIREAFDLFDTDGSGACAQRMRAPGVARGVAQRNSILPCRPGGASTEARPAWAPVSARRCLSRVGSGARARWCRCERPTRAVRHPDRGAAAVPRARTTLRCARNKARAPAGRACCCASRGAALGHRSPTPGPSSEMRVLTLDRPLAACARVRCRHHRRQGAEGRHARARLRAQEGGDQEDDRRH